MFEETVEHARDDIVAPCVRIEIQRFGFHIEFARGHTNASQVCACYQAIVDARVHACGILGQGLDPNPQPQAGGGAGYQLLQPAPNDPPNGRDLATPRQCHRALR